MKRKLRVALMVLLAAVTSVGSAWGDWKEYTGVNGVTWEYKEIESGATCSIRPENRSSISGRVEIPSTVEVGGVSIKVVSIGRDAFKGCSGLTAVTIPGSVTRIGDWSFFGCSGLTSVTIPDGVTAIGNGAFSSCSGLTAATIPNSVTRIGDWSFFGCTRLKAVTIPGSATEIGDGAFSGCSRLMLMEVENGSGNYHVDGGVLFMKDKAALGCYPAGKKAEKYTIPGNVTVIGSSAFEGCSKLTEVVIPSSVTRIERWAFSGCIGLTAVNIPSSVTEIGESAFSGCSGLMAVNIPSSVTEIRGQTFSGCSGLTAVSIPSSVTEIGESAFAGCSGLTAVSIPSSVTEIGWSSFEDCRDLTLVTFPSSVTEIGDGAFSGCCGLKSIEVESGNKNYCAESGVLFTKDKATLICYPKGKPGESFTIPSSVTQIGGGAFGGCIRLTEVTIPSSVTEIGGSAFEGCSGLKEVTIPSSVTAIGNGAFSGCSGLNAVYWLADANCIVDGDAFKEIASPATLYVRQGENADIEKRRWAKKYFSAVVVGYVVTFQDEKGNKLGEQLVKPKGTVAESAAPIREGFTFVEWQLEGAKAGYDFSTPVAEDITLVAKWKKAVKYTVTFNANGGTPTPNAQMVDEGKEASEPAAPTRKDFSFVEWQLDDGKSRYEFSTPVTKDITLVAKWKKNEESTPKDPKTAVESVQLAGVRVVRNPVGEALELEGMERAARVEVYSVAGARVHAEALRGEPRVAIDARGWESGVYVVRVEASDGAKTLRVVK